MPIWYGSIYYPEHWPEERWATDARMMRAAGFTVARLGEFAWCRLEPEEDRFDFDWLARAIETLWAEGIAVLLGTPTAGPPAWLVNAPAPALDCRQVYEDGTRWQFGGRSLLCVNHPRFIDRAECIAQAMSARFAGHPAVMGFQLDNEIGMYGTRCHCAVCEGKFRDWLRVKYGDIETLNRRLGTIFGGGEFRRFDDIPLPRTGQDLHNPGLLLDSERFFSDANAAFLRTQATAIRAAGARQPITTNVCHMFGGQGIDNHELFRALDIAGWDNYPQQFATDPVPATLGVLHAMARGYKGRGYWMLEQQSGAPFGMAADDPRRIRLWAWQSIAHGAEMILYFRWRTCRFGGEQYWRGILNHPGTPNDRYQVVARMGAEVARVQAALADRVTPARAAILLDFDSCQSFRLTGTQGAPRVNYRALAEQYYAALRQAGVAVDVIYEPPAPGAYAVVVAPALRLLSADWAERLRAFVEDGGTLVAAVAFATLDPDHVAPADPLPWRLTELFGIERVEWSALGRLTAPPKERAGEDAAAWAHLGSAEAVPVVAADGLLAGCFAASTWIDHLELHGAEPLARFAAGSPAGTAPAVTRHQAGRGCAVYVASVPEQELLNRLCAMLITPDAYAPTTENPLVEIVPCRIGDNIRYFLLNHAPEPARIILHGATEELLSGNYVDGEIVLEPYDVAIV